MRASYFDPRTNSTAETAVGDTESALALIEEVGAWALGRGRPTVEFLREDGSSLAVSTDEGRAFLVWIDPLGDSHHSVGGSYSGAFVFDYFGSWSEAPPDQLVSIGDLAGSVAAFFGGGSPATDTVLFSPD